MSAKVSWLQLDTQAVPSDVRVSWVAFNSDGPPVDVRVSWVALDTQGPPIDVRVSWLAFDTIAPDVHAGNNPKSPYAGAASRGPDAQLSLAEYLRRFGPLRNAPAIQTADPRLKAQRNRRNLQKLSLDTVN